MDQILNMDVNILAEIGIVVEIVTYLGIKPLRVCTAPSTPTSVILKNG
jgi:hypothetical protein